MPMHLWNVHIFLHENSNVIMLYKWKAVITHKGR